MEYEIDKYIYRIAWSEEDQEFVGSCAEFPCLSWLAPDPDDALKGIRSVIKDCIDDFEKLLVARSDVRLMVFKKHNKSKVEEGFNRLEREAREFGQRQCGDYYILAGRDEAESIFLWREF